MERETLKTKLDPFKNIVIFFNKTFCRCEFKLLNKNLTFCSRLKKYNKLTLNKDLLRFFRNVKLKAHFRSFKQNKDQLKLKAKINYIAVLTLQLQP